MLTPTLLLLCSGLALGDTTFSSPLVLQSSAVWSAEDGPFVLQGVPVTLLPGVTLQIKGHATAPVVIIYDAGASIMVQPEAKLVLHNAVMQGSSTRVGEGVQFTSETGGRVEMDNVICLQLMRCVTMSCCGPNSADIKNSLFMDNAAALMGYNGHSQNATVANSAFFANGRAVGTADWTVTESIFVRNQLGIKSERTSVKRSVFFENNVAANDSNGGDFGSDLLFYDNTVALGPNCCGNRLGTFTDMTFVNNNFGFQANAGIQGLTRVNFIDSTEYHISYSGTDLLDLRSASVFFSEEANEGTVEAIQAKIWDVLDSGTGGWVRVAVADTSPYRHGTFQAGPCAGHCSRPVPWVQNAWAQLGAAYRNEVVRTFPGNGQTLQEALVTGYSADEQTPLGDFLGDMEMLLEELHGVDFTAGTQRTVSTTTGTSVDGVETSTGTVVDGAETTTGTVVDGAETTTGTVVDRAVDGVDATTTSMTATVTHGTTAVVPGPASVASAESQSSSQSSSESLSAGVLALIVAAAFLAGGLLVACIACLVWLYKLGAGKGKVSAVNPNPSAVGEDPETPLTDGRVPEKLRPRTILKRARFDDIPVRFTAGPEYWNAQAVVSGELSVTTLPPVLLPAVQGLLDRTFRGTATRDRGGTPMPTKLRVVHVQQVENSQLWKRYVVDRYAVMQKRSHKCTPLSKISGAEALTRGGFMGDVDALYDKVNEVHLWHGTSLRSARAIMLKGFDLSRAGSMTGSMYGHGTYLAECSSKSDEYAQDEKDGPFQGLFCMILCRVVLGEVLHLTAGGELVHKTVAAALESQQYDSVLGDREASVDTYREFVVFEDALAYPEFIVLYSRECKPDTE